MAPPSAAARHGPYASIPEHEAEICRPGRDHDKCAHAVSVPEDGLASVKPRPRRKPVAVKALRILLGTSIALTLLWVSGFVLYYESGDGMKFWQSIALAFAVGGSGSEAKLDQSRVPLVGIALPLIFMVLVSAIVLVPSGFRGVRSMWPTRLRRLRFTVGSTPMPWPTIVIVLAHAAFVISGAIRYQEKHVGLPPSLLKGVANIFAYASMVDCALFLVPVSRHSILIAATGVPYELAINFHMQLGWAATFCVALHGGMHGVRWTRMQLNPFSAAAVGSYNRWQNTTGLAAGIFFLAITLTSLPLVRRRYYRLFYTAHVVFAPLILIMSCLHWERCVFWVAPSLALYLAYKLPPKIARWMYPNEGLALVLRGEALPDSGGCVLVELRRSACPVAGAYSPGQWLSICHPAISEFEWHPFSIASSPSQDDRVRLVIRAAGPWTRALREMALRGELEGSKMRVEGFCGSTDYVTRCNSYGHAVLVAGGSGITPMASLFRSLRAEHDREDLTPHDPVRLSSVKLVWAVRDAGLERSSVGEELRQAAGFARSGCRFELQLHHTRGQPDRHRLDPALLGLERAMTACSGDRGSIETLRSPEVMMVETAPLVQASALEPLRKGYGGAASTPPAAIAINIHHPQPVAPGVASAAAAATTTRDTCSPSDGAAPLPIGGAPMLTVCDASDASDASDSCSGSEDDAAAARARDDAAAEAAPHRPTGGARVGGEARPLTPPPATYGYGGKGSPSVRSSALDPGRAGLWHALTVASISSAFCLAALLTRQALAVFDVPGEERQEHPLRWLAVRTAVLGVGIGASVVAAVLCVYLTRWRTPSALMLPMCSMGYNTARVRRGQPDAPDERRDVSDEEEAEAAAPLTAMTGPKPSPFSVSSEANVDVEAGEDPHPFIKTLNGRPDFDSILEELTSRAAKSECRTTGVYMSGPKTMVDALEHKVIRSQMRPPKTALVPERLLVNNTRRLSRHHHHGPSGSSAARKTAKSTRLMKRGRAEHQGLGLHMAMCDVHNMSFEL